MASLADSYFLRRHYRPRLLLQLVGAPQKFLATLNRLYCSMNHLSQFLLVIDSGIHNIKLPWHEPKRPTVSLTELVKYAWKMVGGRRKDL